ncbi:MAG: very short patch repair endonuclease [Verrucomicrobia bacterium]|nr:very short patch repair endonuclease [Verrucomicrobiota bacterium]
MADFLTRSQRSERMSLIRSRGNKNTELALVKLLRLQRITGWRRNQQLIGKPDFVFRGARLAVFVDGCFWHGCPKHSRHAAKSGNYWRIKLKTNQARDRLVTRALRHTGWRVLRIWEHELVRRKELRLLIRIRRALSSSTAGRVHKRTAANSGNTPARVTCG